MTALSEFERLESIGLWRPTPDEQLREVIVSFGDATLVLTDKADRALAHWSLPAIGRLNPDEVPAVFSPDPEGEETLELDDEVMIAAIEKVRATVDRRRAQPGRLRLLLTTGVFGGFAALMVFWMPGALISHTSAILPEVSRHDIGASLVADIERISGRPCHKDQADAALAQLSQRLDLPAGRLSVVRSGVAESVHLPGGYVVLNRRLVEDFDDPAVLAGYVVAETTRARQSDPVETMLRKTGLRSAIRLLTTGEMPKDALAGYGETLLNTPQAQLADEPLLKAFEAQSIPSAPYAYARDISGETTLGLIEADPMRAKEIPEILDAAQWAALQEICQ